MSVVAKFLSTSAFVCTVGGCIGLPFYLRSSSPTTQVAPENLSSLRSTAPASVTNSISNSGDVLDEEVKSITKGACNITDLEQDLEKFLQDKSKNKDDYVSAVCNNTSTDQNYDVTFAKTWTGLFPKIILTDQSFEGSGKKFELIAQVIRGEGNIGSTWWVTFGGSGVKETVIGRLDFLDDNSPTGKRVDSVKIQEGNFKSKVIYLAFPRPETLDSK
ncbi:hypothetical protein OVS_04120 [Mycoplasma ovis str. Michigan]|uniref:Lipoprotein n=1 Tax=Mycoplasma ovis str. Michigan TaxID=1415773 RepID=A0ABM5P2G9_9MOLU|nr:hypothetical protein [Mycoplasma ovis]AHC40552.1 hypothetical protein OVS_04120 [Mycoplasma ovis str. Michigan]